MKDSGWDGDDNSILNHGPVFTSGSWSCVERDSEVKSVLGGKEKRVSDVSYRWKMGRAGKSLSYLPSLPTYQSITL